MSTVRIPLTETLPSAYSAELARRIFFLSSEIINFALVERDGEIAAVDLVSRTPLDAEKLTEKVAFVVANDLSVQRVVHPKVIWRSASDRAPVDDTFDRMVAAGMAVTVGEGQVAVAEPVISLMDYFDSALTAVVHKEFVAHEYRYPTLVPTSAIESCDYLGSFPQYLMIVTRLHSDLDVYRSVQDEYARRGRIDSSILRSCDNVDYCLPPTMCFHTFGQYRAHTLANDLVTVTARGKSFRFESRYFTTLERLWDFTIREIVFMGQRTEVLAARKRIMQAMFELMDNLGLTGLCEVGSDPFFGNTETSNRIWSQRMLELKYELRLAIRSDRTVAVGSFNFHDDFFARNFDIRDGRGEVVTSGCVGFGLERLVFAFLSQYGLEPGDWPSQVSQALAKEKS